MPTQTPPIYDLDAALADNLYKYYAAAMPVIPPPVPATGFSDVEQQDINFAWDQSVRVNNNNTLALYAAAINKFKGQPGTIPTGAPPPPPAFVTLDPAEFHAIYLDWAEPGSAAHQDALDYSKAIIPAPLPPAPFITATLPPPPDVNPSLFGRYVQGVWLATALAYGYVQDGLITVGQVLPFDQSPTGWVKYVNGPFAGIPGLWQLASKPKGGQ